MKELAEEFKKQFTCLGENTGKYITFTVPMDELIKMERKLQKNISSILQLIDNARFMGSSLLNLVNNLSEGVHRIKYKFEHDDKKYETSGIKYKYWHCFLEYTNFKVDLIKYKCLCSNKN